MSIQSESVSLNSMDLCESLPNLLPLFRSSINRLDSLHDQKNIVCHGDASHRNGDSNARKRRERTQTCQLGFELLQSICCSAELYKYRIGIAGKNGRAMR